MEKKTTQNMNVELSGRKGVALIMVLTVIMILTVVSVEFQYETRVYVQSTANFRDRLRCEYLARSGVQFSRLLLNMQSTVDQMIKKFWKNNPPTILLWQLIPIDSDLAKAIAGGIFSMQDNASLFKGTTANQGIENPDSQAAKDAQSMGTMNFDKAEGFGDFEGHFHAEIVDEESKINVNIKATSASEKALLQTELESLFSPTKYNPLFENPDRYGQYHDRQEIINAIVDWIDPDNQRSGFDSGDEASRYDFLEEPYPSKNSYFDTLDEVQLVAGIDDRFWRFFGDSFTVYRTSKINVNTCGPEVMRALLEQYLEPPVPQDAEMQRIIDTIMDYRVQNSGFYSEDGFVNFLTNGPELVLELKNGTAGRTALRKAVTITSGTFSIKSSGDINGVMVTLKAVINKSGDLLYYRVE